MKRRILLLIFLCLCLPPHIAIAAVYYPKDYDGLLQAVDLAGSNAQDDIINLGGASITLLRTLEVEADAGFGLSLIDGELLRADDSEPFRLVWFKPVPPPTVNTASVKNALIKIDNIVFSNGAVNIGISESTRLGGAAILFERDALVHESEFINNNITGNGAGGAILSTSNLTISESVFVNNHASPGDASNLAQGGAVAVMPEAGLYISHGYFLNNSADLGGAVHAASNVLDLRITRSTFDSNVAKIQGGAIWSNVGKTSFGLNNVTFIDNEATNGGGAVYSQSNRAELIFSHLTVWGNRSNEGEGGGLKIFMSKAGGSLELRNSILANNPGGNCASINERLAFKKSSHNLFDDSSCAAIKGVQIDPTVAVLQSSLEYTDGVVPTMPILVTGLANDAVPVNACLGFDARDVIRPNAGDPSVQFCDAGAYELVPHLQDTDSDTVRDGRDNCPLVANPLQSDVDQDGKGDACDVLDDRDSDQDMISNHRDNCPMVANFVQFDSDGNGIGDACDQ